MACKRRSKKRSYSAESEEESLAASFLAPANRRSAPAKNTIPKRLAPRSGNQFRVGPPFKCSELATILCASTGKVVKPILNARLDRGFDLQQERWIGYKRNYFTLVSSFNVVGVENPLEGTFILVEPDTTMARNIRYFRIELSSETDEAIPRQISLVQHTAKRDNGPQSSPSVYNIIPGDLPSHDTVREIANVRNLTKVAQSNLLFFVSDEERQEYLDFYETGLLTQYPANEPVSRAVRYDRIQFQYSAIEAGQKGTKVERGFILKLSLFAVLNDGSAVEICKATSPSLLIRGRSPSSYACQGNPANCGTILSQNGVRVDDEQKSDLSHVQAGTHYQKRQLRPQKRTPLKNLNSNKPFRKSSKTEKFGSSPGSICSPGIVETSFNKTQNECIVRIKIIPGAERKQLRPEYEMRRSILPQISHLKPSNFCKNSNAEASGNESSSIDIKDLAASVEQYKQERVGSCALTPVDLFPRQISFSSSIDLLGRSFTADGNRIRATSKDLLFLSSYPVSQNSNATSFERLDKAMKAYETAKIELEALTLTQTKECFLKENESLLELVVPFSLYLPVQGSTSTPIQSRGVDGASNNTKTESKFDQCEHGKRKKSRSRDEYAFDLWDYENADDSSYLLLLANLTKYLALIR
ncbi:hypothetical protein PUMCH_002114 [Australozyma saopauloensis]|uniref:NDT80 domain-containing protein n=1 Tax=Australozyma saopauloensis TaxID=291208 RepID=A0AAX4HAD6_9ASCO|nr:hypothetical protein PUMCH_002114 [[Candida] saopauloensis]